MDTYSTRFAPFSQPLRTLLVSGLLLLTAFSPATADQDGATISIAASEADQVAMAQWGLDRFAAEGLALPSLDIVFHQDHDACGGPLGYLALSEPVFTLHMCPIGELSAPGNRFTMLHELAHAWVYANLDPAARHAFTDYREAVTWDDKRHPWQERATEQAADLIALHLMDVEMVPRIRNATQADIADGVAVLGSLAG